MQEFSAYVDFCAHHFGNIAKCQQCVYGQCIHDCPGDEAMDCYSCLSKIHRKANHGKITYKCQKITFNYILRHGHRYASEIDKILSMLKKNVQLPEELNVVSVGSGPCTELFGIMNQFQDHVVHFRGFDKDNLWKPLTDFEEGLFSNKDVHFQYEDFFSFMVRTEFHVDVLIMNYLLSDIARCQSEKEASDFIDNIIKYCQKGRIHFIVINDIYLTYSSGTGYSLMEELARKLRRDKTIIEREGRGRFSDPNEWQPEYGRRYPEALSFPVVESSVLPYDPMMLCRSIFIIIETKPR